MPAATFRSNDPLTPALSPKGERESFMLGRGSMLRIGGLLVATLLLATPAFLLATPAFAQSAVESFYAGKQITLVVGADTGGGYDALGRLMSRHLGDHIPGKPNI